MPRKRRIHNPDRYWTREEVARWLRGIATKIKNGKADEYCYVKMSVKYATYDELRAEHEQRAKDDEKRIG